MVPVTPVPVSLFGAPIAAPVAAPIAHQVADQVASPVLSAGSALAGGQAPFADLVTEAVGEVEHLESTAKVAIEGLMSGKGVDVHEAMIAAQKASMGFELTLAVRNKALAAYQQVMGMQF
jgi:flagellar hook-basal body complex protein FliE